VDAKAIGQRRIGVKDASDFISFTGRKYLVSAVVGSAKNANNYLHQLADIRLFASILSMIFL
jgi:hypothetical protein